MNLLLALSAPAAALPTYYSDPQPLVFFDEVPVFDVLEVDTGLVPGGASPASVRFFVAPNGGVTTGLEATSYVAWPDPLLHNVRGVPGTGSFAIDGGIDLQAEVFVNLGWVFTGTIPLWVDSIPFSSERGFEPLFLDGDTVEVSGDATILPALEIPVPVVELVDLFLVVEAYPDVSAVLEPVGVLSTTEDGGVYEQLDEDTSLRLPLPEDPAELTLESSYVADVQSMLDIVLEARIELDTFLGPFEVFTFPIPVTLVDTTERRVSEPVDYAHPLPAISELPEVLDFGTVELGQSVALPIAVDNVGLRPLGTEAELGPGEFELRPGSAVIEPGDGGVYTVTFTPTVVGPVASHVWVDSTDPAFPSVEVLLFAEAVEPQATGTTGTTPDGSTDGTTSPGQQDDPGVGGGSGGGDRPPAWTDSDEGEPISAGCACESGAGGGSWLALLLVGLLARRRR